MYAKSKVKHHGPKGPSTYIDLQEFKLHIHNSFDRHVAYMYSYNYTKNILPAGVFTMCGPSTLLEALFFPL